MVSSIARGLLRDIALSIVVAGFALSGCKGTTVTPVKQLTSVAKAGDKLAPIELDRIVFNLTRGQQIGAYRAGGAYTGCGSGFAPAPLTWSGGRSDHRDDEIRGIFGDEMQRAGYKVASNPGELFADMSSNATQAEYLVGGRVDSVVMDVCDEVSTWDGRSLGTQYGEVALDVTWQVFSVLERRVVLETKSRGSAILKDGVPEGEVALLLQGIAAASANLAADKGFHDLLVNGPQSEETATAGALQPLRLASTPAFSGALNANIGRIQDSVVTIRSGKGQGSGFFVAPDLLLTNEHVVGTAARHKIILADGAEIYARTLRRDAKRDVALLQVESGAHPALPLRTARPGLAEEVYAVGSPIDESLAGTVTRGIVSQFKKDEQGLDFIQADVTVQHGSSGGPLLDGQGAVIGLSQSGLVDGTDRSIGINFFIPIADALKHLNLVAP